MRSRELVVGTEWVIYHIQIRLRSVSDPKEQPRILVEIANSSVVARP